MNSEIYFADASIDITGFENDKMLIKDAKGNSLKCGLTGDYQLRNIATTLKTIEVFNQIAQKEEANLQIISTENVELGFEYVQEITGFQGRWQVLKKNPKVVVDTGHNVAGIEYVVSQLKKQSFAQLHIVIGMVNDKDISHVLELLPLDAKYYFTQANIIRALSVDELHEMAAGFGLLGNKYNSVIQAIDTALKNAVENDFVFIGGSNFVVGEALEYWSSQTK